MAEAPSMQTLQDVGVSISLECPHAIASALWIRAESGGVSAGRVPAEKMPAKARISDSSSRNCE